MKTKVFRQQLEDFCFSHDAEANSNIPFNVLPP